MATKRQGIRKKDRFAIMERDGFKCQYCGAGADSAQLVIDHIVPVAEGGSDIIENLITACFDCNSGKGARMLGSGKGFERSRQIADDVVSSNRERIRIAEAFAAQERLNAKLGEQCLEKWWSLDMYASDRDKTMIRNLPKRYDLDAIMRGMEYVVQRNNGRRGDCLRFLVPSIKMMQANYPKEAYWVRKRMKDKFDCILDDSWLPLIQDAFQVADLEELNSMVDESSDIDECQLKIMAAAPGYQTR